MAEEIIEMTCLNCGKTIFRCNRRNISELCSVCYMQKQKKRLESKKKKRREN